MSTGSYLLPADQTGVGQR